MPMLTFSSKHWPFAISQPYRGFLLFIIVFLFFFFFFIPSNIQVTKTENWKETKKKIKLFFNCLSTSLSSSD